MKLFYLMLIIKKKRDINFYSVMLLIKGYYLEYISIRQINSSPFVDYSNLDLICISRHLKIRDLSEWSHDRYFFFILLQKGSNFHMCKIVIHLHCKERLLRLNGRSKRSIEFEHLS